jgi:general secretion pathway protein H
MLISVVGSYITPTLATACAALPPMGALAPWGGPAALDITPTLATTHAARGLLIRGFTLLELLVVIAIIAIASAGATLALRDSSATALEREAQRVAAILEAGRSQSRTLGLPVRWLPSAEGFTLTGNSLQDEKSVQTWLTPGTSAQADGSRTFVLLGPEPIIPAQSITLRLEERSVQISTDGLRPFRIENATP